MRGMYERRLRCISCGSPLEGVHYTFCITREEEMRERQVPRQETRGGVRPDWASARPGEPLPELPPEAYPEPDSEPLSLVYDDDDEEG